MKKIFVRPEIKVTGFETANIICASITSTGLKFGTGSTGTMHSKEGNWFEDEED